VTDYDSGVKLFAMEPREQRVIRNETLFRDVNERISDVSLQLAVDARLELICECGEPGCQAPISLTRIEYEKVRSEATHFAIVPGHEHPQFERLVEQEAGFAVVEKFGEAEDDAEQTDPRS